MSQGNSSQVAGTPSAINSAPGADAETTKKNLLLCREFLKTLGQTIKLMGLYKVDHPVPTSALEECYSTLKEIFQNTTWEEATYAAEDDRWYINDTLLTETAHIPEVLVDLFRLQELHSVTFLKGIMLYELAALCELGAIPSTDVREVAVAEFFKQKGVRNMTVMIMEDYARQGKRRRRPVSTEKGAIESPIPAQQASSGAYNRLSDPNRGFGGFIKSLVEQSVTDPAERARIYSDTLKMVKDTIERRVENSTHQIRLEKNIVLNERRRTESVIGNVGNGRVTVDSEGRILMMDSIAEQIFGKRLVEVAGRPILDCVDGTEKIVSISEEIDVPKDRQISKNIRFAGSKDAVRTFQNSMAIVQDEQGRVVGTYARMPHETKYKEAVKAEEDFISHVTHELKAPLSSICSALELLDDMTGKRLKLQEKKFLDISRRNSARLRTMIDEILDFSKMQAGKLRTEAVSTEAAPILTESVEGLLPWAVSKQIELTVDTNGLTGEAATVLADHSRVVQILTNLISNAIKATPKGGKIRVFAKAGTGRHKGSTVITVSDNGVGISPENQKKIFERFEQIKTNGRSRDGVGLGLSIVRHLITSHRGSLWLESEENKGAAFHFSLPYAKNTHG